MELWVVVPIPRGCLVGTHPLSSSIHLSHVSLSLEGHVSSDRVLFPQSLQCAMRRLLTSGSHGFEVPVICWPSFAAFFMELIKLTK